VGSGLFVTLPEISNFEWLRCEGSGKVGGVVATVTNTMAVGAATYRIAEGVRSTHGQDGAVVLNIRSGRMFGLNPVGSKILEALQGRPDSGESEIAEAIRRQFDVSWDVAQKDVREFLGILTQQGLVKVSSSGSAS
jgi:PqqD family protein of HPr-rel-A system